MPCPCNFKKPNLTFTISDQSHIRYEPKKLRTRSEAIYAKAKVKTLKKQVSLKDNYNIVFKALPKNTTFKVEKVSNENKINLDNSPYNENLIYTLKKGIYTIQKVPYEHALKLKNNDSDKIVMHSKDIVKNDDSTCYYNNIIIMVREDFGTNGIICCSHGPMGRGELFMFKHK